MRPAAKITAAAIIVSALAGALLALLLGCDDGRGHGRHGWTRGPTRPDSTQVDSTRSSSDEP